MAQYTEGRLFSEYQKAAFELEILIRQSAKVSCGEFKESFDKLSIAYEKLGTENRTRINMFSTPESFRARIRGVS